MDLEQLHFQDRNSLFVEKNMEYDKVTLQDKNELDENNVQLSLTLLRSLENWYE